MTLYKYTAFTENGQTVQGELEADSEASAKRALQMQGMFVSTLRDAEGGFSFSQLKDLPIREILDIEIGTASVPQAEIVIFSRQFSTLIEAGIPVIQALDALLEQIEHKALLRIVRKIRTEVNEGSTLADAMQKHEKTFGDLYVNMVHAAETAGRLGPVLTEMSDMLEERQALGGELRSAMTYPVVMLVVGLGVVAFMLTTVVPNITSMFDGSGAELPGLTQVMLSISDFLQTFGLPLLVVGAGIFFMLRSLIQRNEQAEMLWHKIVLNLPVFGSLAHKTALTRFTGTLSVLLKSGVPIISALRIARNVTPFLPYKRALENVIVSVSEGAHLGDVLKETKMFPSLVINMVTIGEKSGQLENMLERLSSSMAIDLKTRLSGLSSLVQPMLLLLMGGLIAFIMGAVLLPIFELNSIAGGV